MTKIYVFIAIGLIIVTLFSASYVFTDTVNENVIIVDADNNNDGIRDDVYSAILNRYQSDTNSRLALMQFAKVLQRVFMAQVSDDKDQVKKMLSEIIRATDCITFTTPKPWQDILFIEALMANTDERIRIYSDINSAASGDFFGSDVSIEVACDR